MKTKTLKTFSIHTWGLVTFFILISTLLSGCKGEGETPMTVSGRARFCKAYKGVQALHGLNLEVPKTMN